MIQSGLSWTRADGHGIEMYPVVEVVPITLDSDQPSTQPREAFGVQVGG
jgi:hypothetical protein